MSDNKDKYINSATIEIQNTMMDLEQKMVETLCKENLLNDDNFLIKDGTLQYNPSFSNMRDELYWNKLKINYKHVVGVSKNFDPELLKDFKNRPLSKTIANLKPFERTKVYRYRSPNSSNWDFAVWYIRLRDSNFRQTNYSDIVKCEMVILDRNNLIDTSLIDLVSENIIKEAYPVCYGKDNRWGNHLYPIYLTEMFCKSKYLNNNIIFNMF